MRAKISFFETDTDTGSKQQNYPIKQKNKPSVKKEYTSDSNKETNKLKSITNKIAEFNTSVESGQLVRLPSITEKSPNLSSGKFEEPSDFTRFNDNGKGKATTIVPIDEVDDISAAALVSQGNEAVPVPIKKVKKTKRWNLNEIGQDDLDLPPIQPRDKLLPDSEASQRQKND